MKSFLCAANWKMNKTPQEAENFFNEFQSEVKSEEESHFLFFVPTVSLSTTSLMLKNKKIGYGAQNIHFEKSGAFTGETSAEMVTSLGATHVLVGHSERRQLFFESNEDTNKKMKAAQASGLCPILCVGETLEQREAEETESVIRAQLLEGLTTCEPGFMVAYEPVWAIGTGKVASPEQANEAHVVLRRVLIELYGDRVALDTHILYGGSVKPENAKRLGEQSEVDGFLIGGASLKVESLLSTFREAQS